MLVERSLLFLEYAFRSGKAILESPRAKACCECLLYFERLLSAHRDRAKQPTAGVFISTSRQLDGKLAVWVDLGRSRDCYLTLSLFRKVAIVNLDPANDFIPYPCAVNVADLITLDDTMRELGLGPNGGIMFCLEYLLENIDWLTEKLDKLQGMQCVG